MDKSQLQALRRLLFFSRPEAAILVAAGQDRPNGVSDRAWRQWEDGDRSIPDDVAQNINTLSAWRETAITAAAETIRGATRKHGAPESVDLVWYDSMDDWLTLPGREPVLWRPQQSVCATLSAMFPSVRLVAFSGPDYAEWLDGRVDSEAMRGQWAASQ